MARTLHKAAYPCDAALRRRGKWVCDLSPMMAVLSSMPDDERSWSFEVKWDGVRILAYCDSHGTQLVSRNHLDVSAQYPELQGLHRAVNSAPHIFDGEIVALDEHGTSSFQRLQERMRVVAPAAQLSRRTPVIYMIFDLLYRQRGALLGEPYQARRQALEKLTLDAENWRVPPAQVGNGKAFLAGVRRLGMEGVIAKRLDSRYEPGARSGAWRKIKTRGRQEFVIGGWTPMKEHAGATLGALLVGYYEKGRLRYAGKVGTGFSDQERAKLVRQLTPLRQSASAFDPPPRRPGAVFARPELVAEVEFQEWTAGGSLRQPAYKGLRDDKPPEQVVREGKTAEVSAGT